MVSLERELQAELENVLDSEELLWKQKLHKDQLLLRDRNKSYFHAQASNRRRGNQVKTLKLGDDMWTYDERKIKGAIVNFFRQLYPNQGNSFGSYPIQNGFPTIDNKILQALGSRVSSQEVRASLFEMPPLKAPRIDGLHAQFYQTQQDVIGNSLVHLA